MKNEKKQKQKKEAYVDLSVENISSRGRVFEGVVKKKFQKRIVLEFERIGYAYKYERYYKKKTRIHARLPDNMHNSIEVGDYVKVQECRPLSKLIHHIVIEKVSNDLKKIQGDKK